MGRTRSRPPRHVREANQARLSGLEWVMIYSIAKFWKTGQWFCFRVENVWSCGHYIIKITISDWCETTITLETVRRPPKLRNLNMEAVVLPNLPYRMIQTVPVGPLRMTRCGGSQDGSCRVLSVFWIWNNFEIGICHQTTLPISPHMDCINHAQVKIYSFRFTTLSTCFGWPEVEMWAAVAVVESSKYDIHRSCTRMICSHGAKVWWVCTCVQDLLVLIRGQWFSHWYHFIFYDVVWICIFSW